jgi:hypothetical protein
MLQAELYGHASREILGNEDYLTSAVFGHCDTCRLKCSGETSFSEPWVHTLRGPVPSRTT